MVGITISGNSSLGIEVYENAPTMAKSAVARKTVILFLSDQLESPKVLILLSLVFSDI